MEFRGKHRSAMNRMILPENEDKRKQKKEKELKNHHMPTQMVLPVKNTKSKNLKKKKLKSRFSFFWKKTDDWVPIQANFSKKVYSKTLISKRSYYWFNLIQSVTLLVVIISLINTYHCFLYIHAWDFFLSCFYFGFSLF